MKKIVEQDLQVFADIEDKQTPDSAHAKHNEDRWPSRGGSARIFWGKMSNDELLRQQESSLDPGSFRVW